MDTIRWFFFLTLAILLIASCNNAAAEFAAAEPGMLHTDRPVLVPEVPPHR